jgi:periplasmic copper chaperone A
MDNSNLWTFSRGIAALLALSSLQLLANHVHAADYKVGSIQISQPWARATPKGASSGAAYMTVSNSGTTAQRLSCVSSDAAGECQIHEMTMDGGVMKMRPVQGGLEVKPGETVTLKPGSFHIMLVGLKQPLQAGNSLNATFKIEGGNTVEVEFPISAIGAPAPGTAQGGQMNMQGPGMMPMNKQ